MEGISLPREGTSLIKFPIVEEVRVVLLLEHMNITPRAITHMPTVISKAKISLECNEKGSFHHQHYQTYP